jgi:hypothetical protein
MNANVALQLLRLTLPILLIVPAAAEQDVSDLMFVFPADAPRAKRSGASRNPVPNAPTVIFFAPAEKLGFTSKAQPVVYWYLSKPTDRAVTLAVNDPAKRSTLVETTLPGPHKAGIHKFDLAQVGEPGSPVNLEPDVEYELVVEVLLDAVRPARNSSATAKIQRRMAPDMSRIIDPVDLARAYRKATVWFDFLDALYAAVAKPERSPDLVRRYQETLEAEGFEFRADGSIIEASPKTSSTQKSRK